MKSENKASSSNDELVFEKKWFAVNGRIPGDDDDTCFVVEAENREQAITAFEEEIWEQEMELEKEDCWERFRAYSYITSVVSSNDPIHIED